MKVANVDIPTPQWAQPLLVPNRYKGVHGGRGSGKSDFFASLAVDEALNPGTRILCYREVQKTLRESVYRLIETVVKRLELGSYFDPRVGHICTPGDGVIYFEGMQSYNAHNIKSLEGFKIAWGEESQAISARSLRILRPTIRMPGSQLWFSWNPEDQADPVDELLRGPAASEIKSAAVVQANWRDNPWFPDVLNEERLLDKARDPKLYDHVWEGGYLEGTDNALWTPEVLRANRVDEAPDLIRIVVAVDPAVTAKEKSDHVGIIVAGVDRLGHGYVLEDLSLKAKPAVWGAKVVSAYTDNHAAMIVAEVNQGGDMVEHTIRSVDGGQLVKYKSVNATKGKRTRAEPISSLYEQGKIHHVGRFPDLEREMLYWDPYTSNDSPDRLDAMVWAFTELMLNPSFKHGFA